MGGKPRRDPVVMGYKEMARHLDAAIWHVAQAREPNNVELKTRTVEVPRSEWAEVERLLGRWRLLDNRDEAEALARALDRAMPKEKP
jgi:hypothetical protein